MLHSDLLHTSIKASLGNSRLALETCRDLSRLKKKIDPAHMNLNLNQGCRPRRLSRKLKGRSRPDPQLAYVLFRAIYLYIDSEFRRTRQHLGCLPIRMKISRGGNIYPAMNHESYVRSSPSQVLNRPHDSFPPQPPCFNLPPVQLLSVRSSETLSLC